MFDVNAQAWRAVRHVEGRSADYPSDVRVNSNFAVDLVLDVGGGERWVELQFHCLGKIPHLL
jgi:hypothetical protein